MASLLGLALLIPASSEGLGVVHSTSAQGIVDINELHEPEFEDVDVRTAVLAPTAAQRAAAAELGVEVRWNRFGTPQSLIRFGGFLATDIGADGPASAARRWVDDTTTLFRLDSSDSLEIHASVPLQGTSAHVVVFRQRIDGLLVSPEGFLSVGVTGSARQGWNVAYASSTVAGEETPEGDAELTAIEALIEAAENVDVDIDQGDIRGERRRAGWRVLEVEGIEDEQLARAVAFPTARGAVRAFETVLLPGPDSGFRHIVDAETGEILFRESIVDHQQRDPQRDPQWKVFPGYPPSTEINRYPWNYPSQDTRDLWCWFGEDDACTLALVESSPHKDAPWDVNPRTGIPTFTTTGNYARSAENWFDPFFPGPTQFQPTSVAREYVFPWQNVWFEEKCDPDVLVVGRGNDIAAATTNLFAGHNRMHNWSYHLGFTERTWNGQLFNFGRGTAENDPLIGMVQAGAVVGGPPTYTGRDNAFMRTLPDGTPSQSGMFLWQPIPGAFYAPCVDGDFDMVVIGHEYTHMIENRMIGKGFRRSGFHAGAMGESYSDFVAMEYLNEYGFVPDGLKAWAVGPYVTGNPVRAIRNYNMSFPYAGAFPRPATYPRVNPLNFSSVGYDLVGPQVHADGEIWSGTNFDIRELFLSRYPGPADLQRECADGKRPARQCPGNRRWIQIVFDAFLLMPTAPTFLDARDAYLAADMMRFGGANQDLLWLAFARRGFGENASTTGPDDTMPVPNFESPMHREATLVFRAEAKDDRNAPIRNAKVFVGHYEARVTPAADTAPGTNVLRIVPPDPASPRHGAYDFVAQADGYGHVRFRISSLEAGERRGVLIRFPTNWASVHQGAAASGDGERHDDLIDDTEGTNWQSTGVPVRGRQVVVELPGRRSFDRAKVSAHLLPGQNRFTALRAFQLYACTATEANPCDPGRRAGWELIHRSARDAFPGDNPRPVAPHLILRTFDLQRTTATHVLFRVVDNQCTGQTSFHGKQDRDPRHETDCRIGTPLPPRDVDVRAAELQLHSSRPEVAGAEQAE